jgi:hypothetical protein
MLGDGAPAQQQERAALAIRSLTATHEDIRAAAAAAGAIPPLAALTLARTTQQLPRAAEHAAAALAYLAEDST